MGNRITICEKAMKVMKKNKMILILVIITSLLMIPMREGHRGKINKANYNIDLRNIKREIKERGDRHNRKYHGGKDNNYIVGKGIKANLKKATKTTVNLHDRPPQWR